MPEEQNEWCRIVEVDGNSVLLMRTYSQEHEMEALATTFRMDHFLGESAIAGEVTIHMMRDEEQFEEGEEIPRYSDEEWEIFCQPENVQERVYNVLNMVGQDFRQMAGTAVH